MIVSHTSEFIYIRPIKVASFTIQRVLELYCNPELDWIVKTRKSEAGNKKLWNHMPSTLIKEVLGKRN